MAVITTRAELDAEIDRLLADNIHGDITAADLRSVLGDLVDSLSLIGQLPTPATQTPPNTPGSPAVGDSDHYARGNHDHGITPAAAQTVTDDEVLDLAKETRTSADRDKLLATAADDQDDLVLRDVPAVPTASTQVPPNTAGSPAVGTSEHFARGDHDHGITEPPAYTLTDDEVLDLAKETRTTGDRDKLLATSPTDQNSVVLRDVPDEPTPSSQVPPNTPGSPTVGTSTHYARGDHDHGVTGSGTGVALSDDAVLDLAKPTRTPADRDKLLATSATDENDVVLRDVPAVPSPSNQVPPNTAGAPAVGVSGQFAHGDHDHGITPGETTVHYKLGNVYIGVPSGTMPDRPADNTGTATSAGITAAPPSATSSGTALSQNWQLTRPEATEALPWVFDCHVYGYLTGSTFTWQFGAPNRTDRYVVPGTGSTGLTQAEVDERVRAGVADFAEQGNTSEIPDPKVPATVARVTFVEGQVSSAIQDHTDDADAHHVPPAASDAAPGNTPGTASAGTSAAYSRGDHDHGIEPGSGGPSQSVSGDRTRVGNFSGTMSNTAAQVVNLTEDFEANSLYQVEIQDNGGAFNPSPMIPGEMFRDQGTTASAPTTSTDTTVASWLCTRFGQNLFDSGVSRWNIQKGNGNRQLYVSNSNGADGGALTIEVWKYPRVGVKGDKGDPGTGGGLDQNAVDARVRALVEDFAETGSSTAIPDSKVPSSIARVTFVEGEVDIEEAARIAADAALTSRIDGLVAAPSEGSTLFDLVAKTYPRDIVFTLGTRIPGGSDPGYNAGSHSLNAAGSFSETGIPPDIVALYRVTESETIGGVQLQNRLIVGIDEEAGSRRYEGERVRWAGQQVTLTYLQRSLNNFNEYRTNEVVTTLATAGQNVAFNVEDVQAEAREVLPFPAWIWHHTTATVTEHISNDDFTIATASETFAPTQHAVAEFALAKANIRTGVRALGSASDQMVTSERGVRVAIDAAVEGLGGGDPITLISETTGAFGNGARAVEFTLTQALANGWLLEFREHGSPGNVTYILSDSILSETAMWQTGQTTGPPHDRAGTIQSTIGRHNNTGDVNTVLYWHRSTNTSKIWIGHGLGGNLSFSVRAFPIGGGGSSGVVGTGSQPTFYSDLVYFKSATATPLNTTLPTGITGTATGYGNLGGWTTIAPTPETGQNILVAQLTRTFSGGTWHVGTGNVGYWYQGTIQHNPIRYIDEGGHVSFVLDNIHHYQQIWDPVNNRYSEPIPIEGRASVNLRLLATQNLPVSGTSTAGPTIATPRTLFSDYPKIGVKVSLVVGNIILRQKYVEIATEDLTPQSVANQNQTRAQRMLALAVNSPFVAGPNWIDVAVIDGNTTVQRHPSGYARRYLMNFVRADNDPAGSTARAFSFINVAEHDAGTFGSGVRIQFYGVQ